MGVRILTTTVVADRRLNVTVFFITSVKALYGPITPIDTIDTTHGPAPTLPLPSPAGQLDETVPSIRREDEGDGAGTSPGHAERAR
jgi:hypothetical protein